jgi:hypothetical protein
MRHVISVRPDESGWAVEIEPLAERRSFTSGAEAEAAAKAIAQDFALGGEPAEIRIHLKDGSLGARLRSPNRGVEWT